MQTPPAISDDDRLEQLLGRFLQLGVITAAAIVVAGGLVFYFSRLEWVPAYGTFVGARPALHSLSGIVRQAIALQPDAIIQAGLLVLIATPVLRVILSLFGFLRRRDWLYVVVTLVVLGVLTVGLIA